MSALRTLAGQTAIYGLSSILALLFVACGDHSTNEIIGKWLPTDSLALQRGAFQEYGPDSIFSSRVDTNSPVIKGKYWLQGDSLFQTFTIGDSMAMHADILPEELIVDGGATLLGSFKVTWHGNDTLVLESGSGSFAAQSALCRVTRSTPVR
jgi:hypothetical protein